MYQLFFRIVIIFAVSSVPFLIVCDVNNSQSDPEFSNVTGLQSDKVYATYPTSAAWKTKLDTVKVSFEYNSSKVKSISVKATIDSGKTWLPVTDVTPNGSNSETVHWIPKNSSTLPKYFGVKHCFIRIADTTTDTFIDTDTFPLIGTMPMILLDSLDNRTFRMTDTIKVKYGANMDLTSNIRANFKTDSMERWIEFTGGSTLPSPDEPTIFNLQRSFVPMDVDSMDKVEAGNFAQPIKILLRDYGTSDYSIVIGNIIIQSATALLFR
jgi:hypothetical protein